MNYPTVDDVRQALQARSEDYRRRIADLRQQLRDEGKAAVDPGHSEGANDIKFNMACIEQLLAALPSPESVLRVVVCADPEIDETAAFALVMSGRGGISLDVRGVNVQTLSRDAPAAATLMECHTGDWAPLGRIVAVDGGGA